MNLETLTNGRSQTLLQIISDRTKRPAEIMQDCIQLRQQNFDDILSTRLELAKAEQLIEEIQLDIQRNVASNKEASNDTKRKALKAQLELSNPLMTQTKEQAESLSIKLLALDELAKEITNYVNFVISQQS